MSTYELARALEAIGHPIHQTGIVKTETADRRVDVDDVIALAVVLGCSPNRLLMPPIAQDGQPVMHATLLVGDVVAIETGIWAWATGEQPLVPLQHMPDGALLPPASAPTGPEVAAFQVENQPHKYVITETPEPIDPEHRRILIETLRKAGLSGLLAAAGVDDTEEPDGQG